MKRLRSSNTDNYEQLLSEHAPSVYSIGRNIIPHVPDLHADKRACFHTDWDPWRQAYYETRCLEQSIFYGHGDWQKLIHYLSTGEGSYQGSASMKEMLTEFISSFPLISLLYIYDSPRQLLWLLLEIKLLSPITLMLSLPPELHVRLNISIPSQLLLVHNLQLYMLVDNITQCFEMKDTALADYARSLYIEGCFSEERAYVLGALLADYAVFQRDLRKQRVLLSKLAGDILTFVLARSGELPIAILRLTEHLVPDKLPYALLLGEPVEEELAALESNIKSSSVPTDFLRCALLAENTTVASAVLGYYGFAIPSSTILKVFFETLSVATYTYSAEISIFWDIPRLLKLYKTRPSHDWRSRSATQSFQVLFKYGTNAVRAQLRVLAHDILLTFSEDSESLVHLFLEEQIAPNSILGNDILPAFLLKAILANGVRVPLKQLNVNLEVLEAVLESDLYSFTDKLLLAESCDCTGAISQLMAAASPFLFTSRDRKLLEAALCAD